MERGGRENRAAAGVLTLPDPNDFPALGSHSQLSSNSTYAAQAQPSGASNQAQLHQQLYLHQQQAPQQMDSSMPPPPPGLAPTSSSQQPNGASGSEGLRDDFPALGDKDQRVSSSSFFALGCERESAKERAIRRACGADNFTDDEHAQIGRSRISPVWFPSGFLERSQHIPVDICNAVI